MAQLADFMDALPGRHAAIAPPSPCLPNFRRPACGVTLAGGLGCLADRRAF